MSHQQTMSMPQGALAATKSRYALWSGLVLGALVTWLYAPVLKGLMRQWWDDPNYSHAFLVP
jgi:hypothetical protein